MKKIILIAILFISLFSFGQSNMGSRMLLVSQAQYVNEVSFDADYQVYLDRLTTLTYTLPTSPTQVLQNQLVIDLKAAGVWSKADVISLFATDGDSNSALVNLYPPASFQNTTEGTMTFTSNVGWASTATDGFIKPNFNLSTDGTNFTLNDNCIMVYAPSGITASQYIFGCYEAGTPAGYHLGDSAVSSRNNSTAFSSNNAMTGTLVGMRRNESGSFDIMDNASSFQRGNASSALPNEVISWIGRNYGATNYSSHNVAFGYIGGFLTDTEITNMKIALDTYYTNL